MPTLAFGLKGPQKAVKPSQILAKRRAAFDDEEAGDLEQDEPDAVRAFQSRNSQSKSTTSSASRAAESRPAKSPKLNEDGQNASKYTNLSALRSAKLHDDRASKLDATVYDYDGVYDTFSAGKDQKSASKDPNGDVPRYMKNLLASAEVRKRDQLRAKERQLQKEREEEGDEFADKEKFVTGAYKKQQEENRRLEEEERRREEEEEERRRKGGGMTAFHKDLLKKDDDRQRAVEQAQQQAQIRSDKSVAEAALPPVDEDVNESKIAAELNEHGANIVVNDEGEIVDKRQLLTAGLNVAPKKPAAEKQQRGMAASRPPEWQRSAKQVDARVSQRERQSRMMEKQIEEMEAKQSEAEQAEQNKIKELNKSKLSESDKLSAKERYLQRKKEREEQAKKQSGGG